MALTKVSRNLLSTSIVDNGNATAITIDSNENVQFSGTISASGYNNSNWDTAYSWGNHATQSYATQSYVNTQVANLVDSAPSTLDTLNELASALGDDANFSTTVTNSIATKWTQDNAKISNWDTAYSWGDHASAGYLTSHQDISGKLNTSGGTLSGNLTIDQGTSGDPTLTLRADTDNNDEGDHPQIRFQQDGDLVSYRFGIGTSASDVSTANNELCITAEGSGSSNLFMVTTAGVQHKFWHEGNDGSGSGLDADTVDGLQASQFLRSDADDSTSGSLQARNHDLPSIHGAGLRFWNGSDSYRIYMASSGTSGAGRVSGETTSDYNMYFRMTGATNRGFVFQSGSSNKAGIDASGNARFTGNVTAYASDARLKENIKPIENPLEKLSKIRGVTYDWKDGIENFDPKCKTETGVIAQEIEAVIPDAISPAPFNEEYKTVEKDKIIALLIEAVKELKAEVDELKAAK